MKKLTKSLIPLAIVMLVGCSKKEKEEAAVAPNCIEATIQLYAKQALDDPSTKVSCENYKTAIRTYLKGCRTYTGAIDVKELEDYLNKSCPK